MNTFRLDFDFTTFKGNTFMGRSGTLYGETEKPLSEISLNDPELKTLCIEFIKMRKPKWEVFSVEIKSIKSQS